MQVVVRTNLDLVGEVWPTQLPCLPNIGDYIQSATRHGNFQLRLVVISIIWKIGVLGEWFPEIELHIKSGSIQDFYKWYAPLSNHSVSSYI